MKLPSEKEVESMFNTITKNLVSNPQIQNNIGNILQGLNECKDLTEVAQKIAPVLGDRKLVEAISETIEGTVSGALESPQEKEKSDNEKSDKEKSDKEKSDKEKSDNEKSDKEKSDNE